MLWFEEHFYADIEGFGVLLPNSSAQLLAEKTTDSFIFLSIRWLIASEYFDLKTEAAFHKLGDQWSLPTRQI